MDWRSYATSMLPFVVIPPIIIFIAATIHRRKHPPTREDIDAARQVWDIRWLRSGLAAVVFQVVYLGSYGLLRGGPSGPLKVALIGAPCLAFAWFMAEFLNEFKSEDEFTKRVQNETASLAVGMFLSFSMMMWVMDAGWPTTHHGFFSAGLGFLPLYYVFSMFVTKAKYTMPMRSQ